MDCFGARRVFSAALSSMSDMILKYVATQFWKIGQFVQEIVQNCFFLFVEENTVSSRSKT